MAGEERTPVQSMRVADEPLTPRGFEKIADLSSAEGLNVPEKAQFALISPEGADVRWRDDGTDPTASVGMPLADGATVWYIGNLDAVKFIEQAASAVLNVSYYGY